MYTNLDESDTQYMLDQCKQIRTFCENLDGKSAQWALGSIMAHLTIRAHHDMTHDMDSIFTTLCIADGNPMRHLYDESGKVL